MKLMFIPLLQRCAALCLLAAAPLAIAAPPIQQWTAPSGARVSFVETHALPMVDIQVDFAAGSAYDPADKAGLASLTRGLLDNGAGDLDENQLAGRLADLGALLTGNADLDRASIGLRTLSAADKRLPAAAVLQAVLQAPRFDEAILQREKARAISGLKEALTRPDALASRAFWSALYPNHPYGRQTTPESLASIERADLTAFWRDHYSAARASIAIVGDLSRADAELLAQQLTTGLPAGLPLSPLPAAPLPAGGEVSVAHPASQSHLAIGLPALQRNDADFFPLTVGNYILGGGGFVSRLTKEVRDQRGYAYSVYSYFLPSQVAGPFEIGLQTKRSQAGDALKVVRQVLAEFLAKGPTAAELRAAKANIVGGFPLRLDSNKKLLDNVAVIGFYRLPLDWLERYSQRVEAVTLADIRAAFARRIDPAHLVTVKVATD